MKGLKCEFEEEMAFAEERLNTWSRERFVAEGYVILGVCVKYEGMF